MRQEGEGFREGAGSQTHWQAHTGVQVGWGVHVWPVTQGTTTPAATIRKTAAVHIRRHCNLMRRGSCRPTAAAERNMGEREGGEAALAFVAGMAAINAAVTLVLVKPVRACSSEPFLNFRNYTA